MASANLLVTLGRGRLTLQTSVLYQSRRLQCRTVATAAPSSHQFLDGPKPSRLSTPSMLGDMCRMSTAETSALPFLLFLRDKTRRSLSRLASA